MLPISFIELTKKHMPLFSLFENAASPFLDCSTPMFPNKIKFILDSSRAVEGAVDPGMYFLLPSGESSLEVDELHALEMDILDGLQDLDLVRRLSLKRCKPFAYKFERSPARHLAYSTFRLKDSRLYISQLNCYLPDGRTVTIADFPVLLAHLLNFSIVGSLVAWDTPFFHRILESNIKDIDRSLAHIGSNLKPIYGKNRDTHAPTLTFRSGIDLTFDLSDCAFLSSYLTRLLFSFFQYHTRLGDFLQYKR